MGPMVTPVIVRSGSTVAVGGPLQFSGNRSKWRYGRTTGQGGRGTRKGVGLCGRGRAWSTKMPRSHDLSR